MKIYIGYDEREDEAARVAANSLWRTSHLVPEFLRIDRLRDVGLLNRPTDKRGLAYDMISSANMSTDFAISRFLVPIICQNSWAVFADCDVVFMRDVHELLRVADPRYAVQVVKHDYTPTSDTKMDNQKQLKYGRKNWSSVMLFNCRHPANRRLTINDVNNRKGLDLHQFYWLHDSEIGELPPQWNWLVGEQDKPDNLAIAHFTSGGPWLKDWQPHEHDEIWYEASRT